MRSCIYAMRHRATRKFYIGSTIDFQSRRSLWKRKFKKGEIPKIITATSPRYEDWEFVALADLPVRNLLPSNKALIQELERGVIDQLRQTMPERILNPSRITTRPGGPSQVRSYGAMSHQTYYRRRREGQSDDEALLATNRSKRIKGLLPVFNQAGRRLTLAEAAGKLGCREDTLKARLSNKRKQQPGLTSITLHELQVETRRWRVS